MSFGKDLSGLQDALGYRFRDVTYLETALTHSSFANELRSRGIRKPSNERLEFLGDAVLQILVSERLYEMQTDFDEGVLTKVRQQVVCGKTLGKIAAEISLGTYLHATDGKGSNDIRTRERVLANTFEALVGAIYLDSGKTEDGKNVILGLLRGAFSDALHDRDRDYKTRLKNLVEQDGASVLEYLLDEESGPDDHKTFFVVCKINNNTVGTGTAPTKKEAEQQAALAALQLFGIFPPDKTGSERL